MSIHKHCDLYYTTKKTDKGYIWRILNGKREIMQTSIDTNEEGEQYYDSKIQAELDARDAIEDYYR